jgi:hypothetical protein
MEEDLVKAREEIQHLASKLRCAEEEKRAIVDEMEAMMHERVRRLEIEVERRERELQYMNEQRRELTQEVGRLHMENHCLNEEYARLQGEIYRLQRAAGETISVQTAQHVGPATSHRREDQRVTTCARSDSPVIMARIVPHDKASEQRGGGRKGGL